MSEPPRPPQGGDDLGRIVAWVAYAQPDRVAVATAARTLTYAELDDAASRLARWLIDSAASSAPIASAAPALPDEPRVLLWASGLVPAVIASVAILRAGMVSVAVDPTTPAARAAEIADRVGARAVLTDLSAEAAFAVPVCDPLDAPGERLDAVRPPASLATIIFTSGSTGAPKGILLPAAQRPVVDASMTATLRDSDAGRELADAKLRENEQRPMRLGFVWAGTIGNVEAGFQRLLLNRGTLVGYDMRRHGPARLGRWLREERVFSCLTLTPTLLRATLAGLDPDEVLEDLKLVSLTGEAMSWEDVGRLRAHLAPDGMIYAAYGMSETGMVTATMITAATDLGTGPLPAGRPAPGRELSILDERGRELPPGEFGELAVTATDLALGYLDEPARSAEVFSTLADGRRRMRTGDRGRLIDDGELELAGRLDHMVKIAGNRGELGEIEAALRAQPGVAEAAATTYRDRSGAQRLIAFVAAAHGRPLDPAALRASLAARLPGASVPDRVEILESLPRLTGGKLDRRSLPVPSVGGDRTAPAPDTEGGDELQVALVGMWARVLDRDDVGLDDDFTALGGDSLRAAVLFADIEAELGLDRPVSLLLEAPTVRALAAALRGDARWAGVVTIQAGGDAPPLFVAHDQAGGLFQAAQIARTDPAQPVYGMLADALHEGAARDATLDELARRYVDNLLAAEPTGPYRLYGHVVGGVIAFAMALELEARGQVVDEVIIADIDAPPAPPTLRARVRRRAAQVLRGARTPPPSGGSPGRRSGAVRPPVTDPGGPAGAGDRAATAGLPAVRRAEDVQLHYQGLARAYRPRGRLRATITVVSGGGRPADDRRWSRHARGEVRAVTVDDVGELIRDRAGAAVAQAASWSRTRGA